MLTSHIKTDERVQSITECRFKMFHHHRSDIDQLRTALGVIRMIKLFAWEAFTVKKVNEKRDAELRQVWKGKRLNVLLGCTNEAVPLVGKVTTFAVYVSNSPKQLRAEVLMAGVGTGDERGPDW